MALTLPRWIALAVIGFAIAAVAILREASPHSRNVEWGGDARVRDDRALRHVGRAVERFRVLQLRDSIRSALGPSNSTQFRAGLSRAFDPKLRQVLQALVTYVQLERPVHPVVPIDLAFVYDTAPGFKGIPRAGINGILTADYVLPRPGTPDRCLVIARVKRIGERGESHPRVFARMLGDPVRIRLLGPCAFYERFGAPGPRIDRWMQQQAWSIGLLSSWNDSMPRWRSGRMWFESMARGTLFSDWGLRDAMTLRGFACVAGNERSCESAVLDSLRFAERPNRFADISGRNATFWASGIVSLSAGLDNFRDNWWFVVPRDLGPRDWSVLGEMVRTLGAARFQQFWTSNETPRDAFRSAAGVELGAWTRAWAERTYGAQGKGPGVTASQLLLSLLVAGAAIAGALLATRRRQVA